MPATITTNVDGRAESQVVGTPEPPPSPSAPVPEAPPSDAAPPDPEGTPADSAPAEETPDSDADGHEDSEDPTEDRPASNKGWQKRVDRMTRRLRQTERDNDRMRAQLDTLLQVAAGKQLQTEAQSPHQTAPVAHTPPSHPRPTEDQFPTHTEYIEAIADWKAEQRVNQVWQEREAREAKARQDQAMQAVQEAFSATEDAARQVYEDYDDVIHAARIQVTEALNHGILSSDVGGYLYYHLSRHPADVRRLNGITDPLRLGKELAKLEAQVAPPAASPRSPRASAPTVMTRAAPPPTPLSAVQSSSTTVNYDTMSFKDYEAHAQQRRGGRR